jgi:hypothetical protein
MEPPTLFGLITPFLEWVTFLDFFCLKIIFRDFSFKLYFLIKYLKVSFPYFQHRSIYLFLRESFKNITEYFQLKISTTEINHGVQDLSYSLAALYKLNELMR